MKLAVQLVRMNMTEKQLFAIVFGVMIGFFVALVIAYFLFPLTGQVDPKFMAGVVDTHHQICPELREANFYRLCVIFGFCFGMVGFYCRCLITSYIPIVVGFIPLVLSFNIALINMIKSVSPGDFYTQADVLAASLPKALLSTVPFILVCLIILVLSFRNSKVGEDEHVPVLKPVPLLVNKMVLPSWFKYVVVLFLLVIVLAPRPAVTPVLGLFDYHRPTFFIGPGLYQLTKEHLAPGKDFSVQYGLAQSFVSALFFAETLPKTLSNLNFFNAGCKIFFFFFFFVFLVRFYRNTFTASVVMLAALALQFRTIALPDGQFEEGTMIVPSIGVYRHAFVPLIWIFALEHMRRPRKFMIMALLCVFLGLALFWINDTGIACLVCVVGAVLLTPGKCWYQNTFSVAAIVFFSLLSFALIGIAVYGPTFAAVSYTEMIKYMRLFACGYASVKAHWSFLPLDLFMYIISNVIIVGTIVHAFTQRQKVLGRFLLMIAMFAAMVKLKFINQTASQHFFGDAFPLLVLFGFWLQKIVLLRTGRRLRWKVIVLAVILFLIYDPVEQHRGIHVGIRSYLNSTGSFQLADLVHSPGNFFSGHTSVSMDGFTTPKKDRDLLEKYSLPSERVFLISDNDAAYLLESKRAPGSPFVPMMDMVFTKNYDDFYHHAILQRYLFVDLRYLNSPLATALLPYFSFKKKGEFLLLMENKGRKD